MAKAAKTVLYVAIISTRHLDRRGMAGGVADIASRWPLYPACGRVRRMYCVYGI